MRIMWYYLKQNCIETIMITMHINIANPIFDTIFLGKPRKRPICIVLPSSHAHAKYKLGCSNASWDIDCKTGNFIKVTTKAATTHIG